jgi:hypothetical protein
MEISIFLACWPISKGQEGTLAGIECWFLISLKERGRIWFHSPHQEDVWQICLKLLPADSQREASSVRFIFVEPKVEGAFTASPAFLRILLFPFLANHIFNKASAGFKFIYPQTLSPVLVYRTSFHILPSALKHNNTFFQDSEPTMLLFRHN